MNKTWIAAGAVLALAACASQSRMPAVDNMSLPQAVRVPAGVTAALHTTGVGEITYECRAKAGMPEQYEWAFVAPLATLYDARRQAVGRYYGGPTWESSDGSKVTGRQVGVAPAAPGNIALQLVQAEPATGMGAMQGVTHIQRLNTRGGVAPSAACGPANAGMRQQVAYSADYVFYRK